MWRGPLLLGRARTSRTSTLKRELKWLIGVPLMAILYLFETLARSVIITLLSVRSFRLQEHASYAVFITPALRALVLVLMCAFY